MPDALTIRRAVTDRDWTAVRAIRQAVFVEEQACPPEEEWDRWDPPSPDAAAVHHLLAEHEGEPVAAARWRVVATAAGPAAKLERFAVLPVGRGRGWGRALVAEAVRQARAAGHRRLVLHAQRHLEAFYSGFGFRPVGDPFWEAGIEHVKMEWTAENRV